MLKSIISTPTAKAMTFNLKYFYLNTDVPRYEYMKIPLAMIPNEIIQQYKLWEYSHNELIHFDIQKGMYGLPQAGRITHDNFKTNIAKTNYAPCKHTPGLWRHATANITFTLLVDDFLVKYKNTNDVEIF